MDLNIAVLDALADDFESIEQIEEYISFLGYGVQTDKISEIIQNLLERELVYINRNLNDETCTWYGMTEKGRTLWVQENLCDFEQA